MNTDELQDLVGGAGAAVLHEGRVVEAAGGLANVLTGLRATPDTLFQVGSTTKLYNAALVMTCVERGELDLDVPVSSYIGDVWPLEATLRQLLSHTGGLEGGPKADLGDGAEALERFIIESRERVPLAKPGECSRTATSASASPGTSSSACWGRSGTRHCASASSSQPGWSTP